MPRVVFAPAIQRHVPSPPLRVPGATVRAALEAAFTERPQLRDYIVDEHGRLRRHVAVFVNGRSIADRHALGDATDEDAEIYVVQALSGG